MAQDCSLQSSAHAGASWADALFFFSTRVSAEMALQMEGSQTDHCCCSYPIVCLELQVHKAGSKHRTGGGEIGGGFGSCTPERSVT